MINYNLHAQGGFTPAAVAPPNAITPEQVIQHYRAQRRGGAGGQALSPPLSMHIPDPIPHVPSNPNATFNYIAEVLNKHNLRMMSSP